MKKIILGMSLLIALPFTGCMGGDKDDNGREDNHLRYHENSTSGNDHGSSTSYVPKDHTLPKDHIDKKLIDSLEHTPHHAD